MNSGSYRKLIEESTDIATVIDPDGEITYVSPSSRDVLGFEPDELVGESGYEYQHPDDREAVAAAIETIMLEPSETETIETRFRHADGSWRWIEATLRNRTDDADIGGILVSSRDISERKQQEGRYQELAEEYEALLETVEDGIFFLSVTSADDGDRFRFERLNEAYEELTGITTEEVRSKTPPEVFGEELGSTLEANYHRCVRAREPISYQEEVPVETGARFWQTNLAPVVTNGEVTRIIGIVRNVTERVERERQVRMQKERLDEFASVVSHDLRNPLNIAQGRAELLAEDCESGHLSPILRAHDRMEELVSDTLALARQGRIVSDPEPIDLISLVGTCWGHTATEEATIEMEEGITIAGDRSRLQHVFENLLRNAIEHGGRDVTVRVGRIDDGGIFVEDTGPGIPPADREAVFEAGHTSTSGGTGFGLTIIKRIAEAHGWEVAITDGTDGGARFEFTNVDVE